MHVALAIGIAAAGAYAWQWSNRPPTTYKKYTFGGKAALEAALAAKSGGGSSTAVVGAACKGLAFALPIDEKACQELGSKFWNMIPTNKAQAADAVNRKLNGACRSIAGYWIAGDAMSSVVSHTCKEFVSGCKPFSKCPALGKCKSGTQPMDLVLQGKATRLHPFFRDGRCP